jgi:hypothetical protein
MRSYASKGAADRTIWGNMMGEQRRQAQRLQPGGPGPEQSPTPPGPAPLLAAVTQWTGKEARALRIALRMPLDRFAGHINAGRSTVTDLEHGREKVIPTWGIQEALDEALSRASNEAKKRFGMLCEGKTNVSVSDSTTVDGNGDDADRERFLKVIGAGLTGAVLVPLEVLERSPRTWEATTVWMSNYSTVTTPSLRYWQASSMVRTEMRT